MAVYGDVVRYRELFRKLFRRDFHAKYRGSALGVAWSLLNPAALMAVYLLFFGVILDRSGGIPHYPIYLLSGIACWIFFAVSLQTASRSLIESSELIKKVRFPRQLVALSVVATQAVTFVVMLVILIVLSLVFVPEARSTVWLVIPLAILYAAFVAGVSLVVACLNVILRDVEHILTAALIPWFFLTPILWSVATLPARATSHHKLIDVLRWGNFVAPPVDALRDTIWLGRVPRPADLVYLVVAAVVSLALGAFVFTRVDDRLAIEL
ncbi:MAG TPA: ABC transporter permease [Gaiellaceae bacterium]|jgi:ABC-type polysaccharide/polyol phosphate export permease